MAILCPQALNKVGIWTQGSDGKVTLVSWGQLGFPSCQSQIPG